jgi:histidinol-phosphate/aromatic aminotransferase/cobyric acid decarboxylase-like protein
LVLAYNENPEPVAPEVLAGIESGARQVNRYTLEAAARVLTKLADYYRCPEQNLALVRGIDEAFDRLSNEFPGMRYASAWPGFDGYIGRTRVHGYRHLEIGLRDDFGLAPEDLTKLTRDDFVFLADPSNPTGRPLSAEEHRVIRARAGKICLDETYFDYGENYRPGRPAFGGAVFIFRSFSKSFGLAGARLGIVFGDERIITNIKRKQWYCNVGILDLCALEAALENNDRRCRHIEQTIAERERIRRAIAALGLHVYPSAGNFILLRTKTGRSMYAFLHDHGIRVRNTEQFGLPDHLRITIGRPADNDRLLAALGQYTGCDDGE